LHSSRARSPRGDKTVWHRDLEWTTMNEAGPATAREESPLRSEINRAGPLIVAFGRFGYVVEGLVFILVGLLAARVALGLGGEVPDNRGVLPPLAASPLGRILLIAIAIGFVGYALWRFLEAAFDPDGRRGGAYRPLMRLGNALNGALHLGFAVSVARLLLTGSAGANTDATAKGLAGALLAVPYGRWLVGLVGLGVLGFAAYQGFQALKAKFRENAQLRQMSAAQVRWYTALGQVGFAARGVSFASIGLFLLGAARDADPLEARGLDTALDDLATRPFGPWLLGLTALGLVAYGLFLLAEAYFHRVAVA
jgi:hypothetical protein